MIPALFRGLLDDAAVFPPGLLPLAEAVPAHARHRAAPYREIVGPLVLAAPDLAGLGDTELELAVTAPGGPTQLPEVFARVAELPVRLAGLEVTVPAGMSPAEFFGALPGTDVPVFERHTGVGHRADPGGQFGFVRVQLCPDPAGAELGLPPRFRAPADHLGTTLVARDLDGTGELASVLAERDGRAIADRLSTVDDGVRAAFRSFGTCSIIEPLTELAELGLVDEGVIA